VNLRALLRQQLRRSHPDSFVVVNAWNEWGEGTAIEPSVEHGDGWLRAIEGAITDASTWKHEVHVPGSGVGVLQSTPADKVCIVVRTFAGHGDGSGLFGLRMTLGTLVALDHVHWDAYIIDTGDAPFEGMAAIVDSFADGRLHATTLPDRFHQAYDGRTSAFDATDHAVDTFCTRFSAAATTATTTTTSSSSSSTYPSYRWFLVTNGDNFYAPDALYRLPAGKADAQFMNFYSRYTLANALTLTSADATHCCTRLLNGLCHTASPQIGHIDLGAMVVRVAS